MLDRSKDWREGDLLQLIQEQVQESLGLDYKAAGALGVQDGIRREIAKDISAFANSAGGIVVYGMQEDGHVPTAIDPVTPNPFTKEWLENVIISNIQPRISGLHINPIQLSGPAVGRFAYAVTIPQSHTAHQAPDHRYYKRFNFQSVPMEHYEIQDAMNRSRTPIVDVTLESKNVERGDKVHVYRVHICLKNTGAVTANNIKLILKVPGVLDIKMPDSFSRGDDSHISVPTGDAYVVTPFTRRYTNLLLFPLDRICEGYDMGNPVFLKVDQRSHEAIRRFDMRIEWTIYADDMIKREGSVRVLELINY